MSHNTSFISSIFVFLLAFFTPIFSGQASENCPTDITTNFTGSSWEEAIQLEDEDGFVWQRAIVNQQAKFPIREGEATNVYGFAEPFSEVYLFVYGLDRDNFGNLIAPGGRSNCFLVGKADQKGIFSYPIAASLLWGAAETDMVFDAYYKKSAHDLMLSPSKTNQNFFIGTAVKPAIMKIVFDLEEKNGNTFQDNICKEVCPSGIIEAVNLRAGKLNQDQVKLMGASFDSVGWEDVNIGRQFRSNTYYAGSVEGVTDANIEAYRLLTKTSLTLELLKRALLGDQNVGGIVPGLDKITAVDVRKAAEKDIQYSEKTQDFAIAVKNILMGNDAVREDSSTDISQSIANDDNAMMLRKDEISSYLQNALTSGVSEEGNWAENFIQIIAFWTGKMDKNQCLLSGINIDSVYKKSNLDSTRCNMRYVSGITPRILLNTQEPISLEPDFQDTQMILSDTVFDEPNQWNLPKGKKEEILYRYEFTKPFLGSNSGDICIRSSDMKEFSQVVTEEFSLSEEEKNLLEEELQIVLPQNNEFLHMTIVDEKDIARRFSWKGNDRPISLLQLFFHVDRKGCFEKNIDLPVLSGFQKRDGFEVGFIQ